MTKMRKSPGNLIEKLTTEPSDQVLNYNNEVDLFPEPADIQELSNICKDCSMVAHDCHKKKTKYAQKNKKKL